MFTVTDKEGLMKTNTTVENLRAEHARLDAIIREEESHIWKNLIRIEELKREKLRKKDEILRHSLQNQ